MKTSALLLLVVVAFGVMAMQNLKPIKVIFFGDSITEAGVHSGGYIDRARKMLKEINPANNFQLIGAGIGGNKVYDLYLRVEDDVLSQKPDWVFIYVGVNDVWHKKSFGTGTDPDKFERFYVALIKKLQAHGIQVALCTPAVIGEKADGQNEMDADLNKFSQIIRTLAAKYDLPLVDLRRTFFEHLTKNNSANKDRGILTTDTVHLNEAGNQFVAEQVLKVLVK